MDPTLDVLDARIYEPGEAVRKWKQQSSNEHTPKKKERPFQPAAALSPSSTGLVSPLSPQLDLMDSLQPTHPGSSLYCSACKKKFNNQSTFSAHHQSDKHRKNSRLAKQSKQAPTSQKKGGAAKHHPVVQNAISSIRKAQGIMKQDPAVAATVLWNVAKDISQYNEHSVTQLALEKALACLQCMEDNKELRGGKGSSAPWSARALLKTMLECRLALARLKSLTANETAAAQSYIDALCAYLGISQNDIDQTAKHQDPNKLDAAATELAKSIPRKFAKPEDIDQAIATMEEVAGVLFMFSGANKHSPLAWQSVAIYFLAHSFAILKEKLGSAYTNMRRIISAYNTLCLEHLGCECAILLISHHATQQTMHRSVAEAAVDSLLAQDLVRAQAILQRYNSQSEEPWSKYLAKFLEKTIQADVDWLQTQARPEWDKLETVCADSSTNSQIHSLVAGCLDKELGMHTLYTPNVDGISGQ